MTADLADRFMRKLKAEGVGGVAGAIARRMNLAFHAMAQGKKPQGTFRILYVNGCTVGESARYRICNLIEALEVFGVSASAVLVDELAFQRTEDFDLVVFFRCALNNGIKAFLARCKERGVTTVFDVDDLVFDESIIDRIDAYNHLKEDDKLLYRQGVKQYRAMLEACDFATASTEYLCQCMTRAAHKEAFLIRNGINRAQIKAAADLPGFSGDTKRIGYLSGSKTHQRDFDIAVPALVDIMKKNHEVMLTVVGELDIPSSLEPFMNRIERYGFMDYRELLKLCAQMYLIIVPLEFDTEFCSAKSELKYFEQALIGVPVVASPTPPFCDAIADGDNGFIAQSHDEWVGKMQRLLDSPQLRNEVGNKAAARVRTVYYPEAIGKQAKEVYGEILLRACKRKMDAERLRVSMVIPEPFNGAGGHRNIFRIARAFSRHGHKVTIYVDGPTGRFSSDQALKEFVAKHFFETRAEFHINCDDIEPCDLFIATHWHTAYIVQQFRHRCITPCYFIQDFEPYFYPMGEEYIQAYATYSFGFSMLASGKWAAKMVERVSGKACPYFTFPLQREVYCENKAVVREQSTVLFFARPQMPRRCYMLGVQALQLLKKIKPDAKIVFYGSAAKDYGDYGFDYEKKGLLSGPQALAELYQKATVGVCFSLTNPSLVPYEMMACGLPVVDLDFNESMMSYDGYDTALLVQPSPQAICNGIAELLDHAEKADRRRVAGIALVSQMPDEEQIGAFAVETFRNALLKGTI